MAALTAPRDSRRVTEDRDIRDRINALIDEEHRLRAVPGPDGSATRDTADGERLARIEVELDQCWDLLRQRQARREFGADPTDAEVRPAEVVERYQN